MEKETVNSTVHHYIPDERVTKKDMFRYGYKWGGVLPVLPDAARRYALDVPVYALYPDGSESFALPKTLMSEHELYGIEIRDWVNALKQEMESHIENGYLVTEWNGFHKGMALQDVMSWFEDTFDMEYLKRERISLRPESIQIETHNFHMEMCDGYLIILIRDTDDMKTSLEFYLGRRIEGHEKWMFYLLFRPKCKPVISAVNSNLNMTGKDGIRKLDSILDDNELDVANAFIEKYRLADVYYRYIAAARKGAVVL